MLNASRTSTAYLSLYRGDHSGNGWKSIYHRRYAGSCAYTDLSSSYNGLAAFVRNIKSNSSRWIKGLDMCYNRFSWQEGYGAFSVSESMKEAVTTYIDNQARHHQKFTMHEEFALFMKKYGEHNDSPKRNSGT